jgi:hypothetical protein
MKKTQVINRSDTTVKKVKRIEGVGCIKTEQLSIIVLGEGGPLGQVSHFPTCRCSSY